MKLSWSQLEALLDALTDDVVSGRLSLEDYNHEWDEVMTFAGWTWDEFVNEVDKRWTPEKKQSSLLFRA